jgi:ribonuclease III
MPTEKKGANMNRKTLNELQQNIGYQFKQEALLRQALTHSSYAHEKNLKELMDNERLEFLGDAVLQIWVSNRLFRLDPPLHEGKMTTTRAQLVCEKSLASYARSLGLPQFLKLGIGEEKSGGRDRDSIIANSFEALLGAVYYDAGMDAVDTILNQVIAPISASQASDKIESLSLPPVKSSPLPSNKKFPSSSSLAHDAKDCSHTRLARSFVICPSFISG